MDELIEKSHFKSYSRLYPIIKKRFPNVSKAEVIEAIEKKFHDRHMKHTQKRPYMNRIFDPVIGCYFHDLFVNSKNQLNGGYHRYFHVFIESNSRYVFAYPVDDKDANTAIDTLDKFINDNQGKPIGRIASSAGGIIGMMPGHVGMIGKALFAGGEAIKSLTNSLPDGAVKQKLNDAIDKGLTTGGAFVNSAQRLAQKVSDSGQKYLNAGSRMIDKVGTMATDFANH